MSFVHLHNHTQYSLLEATTKVEDLIKFAKKNEHPAIAMTDKCNLYGAFEFYSKALKEGIKPIIGVELELDLKNASTVKKTQSQEKNNTTVVLLAKDNEGLRQLYRLISLAHFNAKDDLSLKLDDLKKAQERNILNMEIVSQLDGLEIKLKILKLLALKTQQNEMF